METDFKAEIKSSLYKIPKNNWSDVAASKMSASELLLYRSNLLGSDLTITNYGGGNTSAKLEEVDPLSTKKVKILWVKGSGGDIGSMKIDGFSTLYLDKLLETENLYRGVKYEDEMVGYLPHCNFNLNSRAASIDTPLHGFLPYNHIDHVHPDSIIALAAAKDGEKITNEIWGGKVGWVAWQRPGFELGMILREYVKKNPNLRGIMLAGHGIICWAHDSKSCYENTINLVSDAANFLNRKLINNVAFGGRKIAPLNSQERNLIASKIMPNLRGLMSQTGSKIGHFSDTNEVLEFVCSNELNKLAQMGTSCPDHFLRTKIRPLVIDVQYVDDKQYIEKSILDYQKQYSEYYKRCATAGDPKMRDPNPIVILVPSVGMFTFASDKTTARLAAEFYQNAINVMRGAQTIGGYIGLDEKEAFRIEYWALEEAKLQRMPKPKPLAGKIAFITGGAGGIGFSCAQKLLQEGACVLISDLDKTALLNVENILKSEFSNDVVRAQNCDVTDEAQVIDNFNYICREFGGVDILVANAGIASSAPIEDTSVELWRKNYDVLVEGYFLAARETFKIMKQSIGGSIIFVGSKNAIAAAANASAYSSAKAASLHLARCLALEGAGHGIRVNVVNPDAVIRGSKIWSGEWRKERADTHGIDAGDELEAHYRNRSMLKLDVLPEDIAKAVYFFASDLSAKSTGNMINVDAGNAGAFPR